MDFVSAISPDQYAIVHLGGQTIRIDRARLGGHIRLSTISESLAKHMGDSLMSAALIFQYLHEAGAPDQLVRQATSLDLLETFHILHALNGWGWIIPMFDPKRADGRPTAPPDYDYPGRRWAIWIHRIAKAYGWSRDQILALWPEEAAVYIQEIMVSEYLEREDTRSLSELAYTYNKATKTYQFNPSPKPSWMVNPTVKTIRIKRSLLPVGNVIGNGHHESS